MKALLILVCLSVSSLAYSQEADSIQYANGYLHYHSYGEGEPVVILTGGPGAGYLQLEDLAKRVGETHHAILLEQRGTGRSMPVPYDSATVNIRTAQEDIIRLLEHLSIEKASLVGHSWGGMLGMTFATQHPERVASLLLIDSGPFSADRRFSDIYFANREARLSTREKEERGKVFAAAKDDWTPEVQQEIYKWELVPVLFDRTKVDSLTQVINRGGLNPQTGSMLIQSFMKSSGGLKEKLHQLKVPVHIIAGAQDPGAFLSYELKQLIPQSTISWINRSGHFPMYEQPEEFYKVLKGILPE